ncbi:hypothetical protein FAM09_17735 [Niastella caeni]|uniref:Uncharacterized protein n=1 Tax=Niastella caeni TaxID=2569763 RepID=A0A4S8HQM6_9BACT|nr:hypothetical protein [Niastella caeni]THU36809.1 hypothetical protein FAM09_17735 [Niastella caeni]
MKDTYLHPTFDPANEQNGYGKQSLEKAAIIRGSKRIRQVTVQYSKRQIDLSLFSYGKQSLEASRFYGWLFLFCFR